MEIIEDSSFKPGFLKMYQEFKSFIKNKDLENKSDISEALRTLNLCWDLLDDKISDNYIDF